jgi:hypothetical protein
MKTHKIVEIRAAGSSILIGSIAMALVAQSIWTLRPASAGPPDVPITSAESTVDVIAVPRPATPSVNPDGCETQHWPFYSKECLRGEDAASIPRLVSLQQASATEPPPAAPLVAAISTAEQRPYGRPQILDTPRHRKVRQSALVTKRPAVRGRQMPQVEPGGTAPVLSFTW